MRLRREVRRFMRTTSKRQDNINVRLGFQTKSDLVALAQALEITTAELVRQLVRQAIDENQEKIQAEKIKGIYKDNSIE